MSLTVYGKGVSCNEGVTLCCEITAEVSFFQGTLKNNSIVKFKALSAFVELFQIRERTHTTCVCFDPCCPGLAENEIESTATKYVLSLEVVVFAGISYPWVLQNDPGRTRTCNPRLRRPMPYPLGHGASCVQARFLFCNANQTMMTRAPEVRSGRWHAVFMMGSRQLGWMEMASEVPAQSANTK